MDSLEQLRRAVFRANLLHRRADQLRHDTTALRDRTAAGERDPAALSALLRRARMLGELSAALTISLEKATKST